MTDLSQPIDQHLELNGISVLAKRPGPGQPFDMIELHMDVTHVELRSEWKQGLLITDEQLDYIIDLLTFTRTQRQP